MASDELRIRAVLDLTGFNAALGVLNSGLAAVGNAIKEIGVGALRYVGELAVRSFVQAGRAALNFARDVATAAFQDSVLSKTLADIYAGLVNVTRVSFTPLVNEINRISTAAAPAFLGVVQRAEEYLGGLATDALAYGENVASQFAQGIWDGFVYVVDALTGLGNLITYWLSPGSPPRILPDLDQWGADALQVYLSGWANGDFSVFNKVSSTLTGLIRSFANPLGKNEGLIPQILGTRGDIARAVDELRRTGTIATSTLDSIVAGVGHASAEVRGYLESMIALEVANADVAAAQKAVNAATDAYNKLLAPIDARLGSISESQQQLTEEQEKGRLALTLKDPNALASEKRQAALRIEQIDAERARRAAILAGGAAVDAATDQLAAATAAQAAAKDSYDAEAARLAVLAETNGLINDQIKLLDSLNEAVKAVAGGAKGGAKGGGVKPDTTWIDELVKNITDKLGGLQTAWAAAWAAMLLATQPVRDFIRDHVTPILAALWSIIKTQGAEAVRIIADKWNKDFKPALKVVTDWIEQHVLPGFTKMFDWMGYWLVIAASQAATSFNTVLLPAVMDLILWMGILSFVQFKDAWEWMQTKLPAAAKTLSDFFNNILKPAIITFGEAVDTVFAGVKAAFQGAIDAWNTLTGLVAGGGGSSTGGSNYWNSPYDPNKPYGGNVAPPATLPPGGGGSSNTNTYSNVGPTFNLSTNTTQASSSIIQDFAAMRVWSAG